MSVSESPDEIFNDALELSPERRPAFLARVCGGDDALRRDIEELLRIAEEQTGEDVDEVVPDRLGRYQILGELGHGGMGIVYRALDADLKREVALKCLPSNGLRNDARLEREARILAGFTDPHIATIYSIEKSDGIRFVTMELVEGETLESLIAHGPMPPERAAGIVRQIAAALETAHAEGVVHRDIKPANVVVRKDGLVKVLDFGIARVPRDSGSSDSQSGTGTSTASGLQGTPAYISPEVLTGAEATPRSDLWATGCILFECLTGRRLFPSFLSEPGRQQSHPELPRSFPRALRIVVCDLLQYDPERRISTATELRRRLETFLGSRRRRAVRTAVALVMVAAAAFGIMQAMVPARRLATVERHQARFVRGLSTRGEVLWQRELGDRVMPNFVSYRQNEAPYPVLQIDGGTRAFVGTYGDAGKPARFLALDGSTGETIWEREVSWRAPLSARGPLHCRWMFELEGTDHGPALVLGLRDGMWYSMAVRTIRADGTVIGTYYHPGDIFLDSQIRLEDGRNALLLYGGNSSARFRRDIVPFKTRQHPAVVALVVPVEGDVQAFPYSEGLPETRDWPDIPRASEEAYLIIPPIHAGARAKVQNLIVTRDRQASLRYLAKLDDGRTYTLDRLLLPLSCFVGIGTPAESLQTAGGTLPALTLLQRGKITHVSVPADR